MKLFIYTFSRRLTSGLPVLSAPSLIRFQFAFPSCDGPSFVFIAALLIASLNRRCQWFILIGVRRADSEL